MNHHNKNTVRQSIEALLSDTDSDKLIIKSLQYIKPSVRRRILALGSFFILTIVYLLSSQSHSDAVIRTIDIVGVVNNLALPILGLAVTGYAIFQALANGDTLITLLKVSEGNRSKFQEYNYFFLAFSILYIFIIGLNFVIVVFLKNVTQDWHIAEFPQVVNNTIYSMLMSAYITFILNALVETKCFVYNLYQIFSTNAAAKGITYLQDDES
ncbi:hypothetical protein MO973_24590 [Paenibacillus sp. TRM 82003]|nr:hypothetical protein [Paenibacillus sp. TRM 82003]MCI3923410.1 hypothetical protein [Paenibacillus sp. TRM 82003]